MVLIIVAAVVILTLLFSYYTYRICFRVAKYHIADPYARMHGPQFEAVQHLMDKSTDIMEKTQCEYVSITSCDGLSLHARYYHIADGAPVIIAFHGYRSCPLRDCTGGFSLGLKMNYNVLAVDQRSHGQSGGRAISFGVKERYDCLGWTEYIRNRFGTDTPVILYGISMGAATVLMSASLDLPCNVRGIMADCPYSSPSAIIRRVSRTRGYPPALAYPFIWLGALIYGGFILTQCDAVSAVKMTKLPILLIHGGDDRFIPYQMSEEIYQNCADHAKFYIVPSAGHGLSYIIDPPLYEKICKDFFDAVIN